MWIDMLGMLYDATLASNECWFGLHMSVGWCLGLATNAVDEFLGIVVRGSITRSAPMQRH